MSKLLINEPPLQVLPSLAREIGLEEAIVLQQLHYLMQVSANIRDGRTWVYNTHKEWAEKYFTWTSEKSVHRFFKSLRDRGLVVATDAYNSMKMDKTLWYSIDYEAVSRLESGISDMRTPFLNSERCTSQFRESNNQETTQENTQYTPEPLSPRREKPRSGEFEEWWKLYKRTAGTSKEAAWKAWQKINPGEELLQEIMAATEAYNSHWENNQTATQYIPHPASWLNDKRWESPPVKEDPSAKYYNNYYH